MDAEIHLQRIRRRQGLSVMLMSPVSFIRHSWFSFSVFVKPDLIKFSFLLPPIPQFCFGSVVMWLALQLTLLTVLTFDIVCITFGFTLLHTDIIYSFTSFTLS